MGGGGGGRKMQGWGNQTPTDNLFRQQEQNEREREREQERDFYTKGRAVSQELSVRKLKDSLNWDIKTSDSSGTDFPPSWLYCSLIQNPTDCWRKQLSGD